MIMRLLYAFFVLNLILAVWNLANFVVLHDGWGLAVGLFNAFVALYLWGAIQGLKEHRRIY